MAEIYIGETNIGTFKLLVSGYPYETYDTLSEALEGARGFRDTQTIEFRAYGQEERLITL